MTEPTEDLTPTITINGVLIRPSRNPKTKLWREMIRLTRAQAGIKGLPTEEALDDMESLLVETFKDERVTKEALQEEVDLEDFMPLFQRVSAWINHKVGSKMKAINKVPNE